MQVVDRVTGKTIEVPDDVVQAGFQSGKYALPKGTRIPIQRADGDIGTVPSEGLDAELQHGASIVPQSEYDKAAAQQKYGGLGGMAVTGGLGALSGATAGLSDVAAGKISETSRKYVQEHYQANPTTKTIAQVAGALAPALGGDEAGLATLGKEAVEAGTVAREGAALAREGQVANEARALATTEAASRAEPGIAGRVLQGAYNTITAPTHLTSEAGRLAERFAGAIVGDNSPSLLARTAQNVIKQGGAGAIEGALYGLGNELSEEALGGQDFNAQKLAAAVGHNTLFGLALGGALGGGGTLAKAGLQRIARSEALGKLIDVQALRSLSPNKPLTREMDKYVEGGSRAVGHQLVEDNIPAIGDGIDELAPKVRAAKQDAFDNITNFHKKLEDLGAEGPKLDDIIARLDKRIPDLDKKLGEASPLKSTVDKYYKQLGALENDKGRIALKDLNDFRKRLDDETNWATAQAYGKGDSPETQLLKGFRGEIEEAFTKQADSEVARLAGKDVGATEAEYKALKARAQKYILADKSAQQALAAKYSNNGASLTDKMAGFTVGGSAVAGAIASGGASIPAHIAHAALGAAATYGHKVVRERGNATVAALLHKARDLGAIAQVTKRFDGRVTKEVAKALQGVPYRSKPIDLDDYDSVVGRVTLAQSKIAHDQAIAAHLGTIQESAPKHASAFDSVIRRGTSIIAQKLPPQTYHPLGNDPPPSDAQKAEVLRAARIIDDPLVLMKDIRAGTATADDVATLQKYAPDIYVQMQSEISKQIKTDKTIPYANILSMSRLMKIDLDGTYNPRTSQLLQMTFQGDKQKPPAGGAPKHRKSAFKTGTPAGMTLNSRAISPQYSHI